jgi:uncharacterized protein YbaP (TraB family)
MIAPELAARVTARVTAGMIGLMKMREYKMRRSIEFSLGLLLWALFLPQLAAAQCAGTDLLAGMETTDPAAHAALFQRAHAVQNAQGKFWRVSRAGTPDSYLLGTFHDTGIARQPLDPAVTSALRAARLMLVEVTEEEQALMQARMASDPTFVVDPRRVGLSGQLSATERAVAERALAGRGVTLQVADKLRPWMLFSLLAVPQCMLHEAQQGQPILDELLMSDATEAGIPVAGLETYQQAINAIASIPADTMNELLLEMLRDLSGEEDTRRTSVELYQAGEIAAIWEFSIVSGAETVGIARSREIFGQFSDLLLDARNWVWMKTMVPQLETGGVFAAFGAMHLVGEAGVIELLRAQGFVVTRLDG